MCGICGIWNYTTSEPVQPGLLRAMTSSMHHRGPDDEGWYTDDSCGIGLGFRRLSIIDLSPAGHQPMCNEDESVWIVFNGEVYNFLDLRPGLEARGHSFRSRTDTEVLIHQYEERGPAWVEDLNGMFGLALWDGRERRLVLARDRVGKKPLYYYDDGYRIIFASELKALVCDPSVPRQLDAEAVAEYLSLGYIGSPRTIFRGIRKLPPAHVLVHQGGRATVRRYWDWLPAFQPDTALSEEAWHEQLRETLREAVKIRMISDVPLGAFLSGGVDSSAVVATMAELSNRPVKTFSIGFEHQEFNELPYARMVVAQAHTEHREYIVQPENIADILPRLAHQLDEPFGDPSALPTYYVSKIARQDVTVCLSGDGGDEALAGYDRYAFALSEAWVDRIPHWLRLTALTLPTQFLDPNMKGLRRASRWLHQADGRYAFAMEIFNPPRALRALAPDFAYAVSPSPPFLAQHLRRAAHLDHLSRIQYLDSVSYLPEDILVKVDRTSMLNSLETRCPLLDYRFLELAAHIPSGLRLRNGQGKYVFKQALRGLVPDGVLDRPKMGFGIPGEHWLAGDATAFVQDVVLSQRMEQRGIFQMDYIKSLVTGGTSLLYRSDTWSQLWLVLIFELWCRAYLDG